MTQGRERAQAIWSAAVAAVRPEPLVRKAVLADSALLNAVRVLVVGAGKAGARMALGLEEAFQDRLDRLEGLVNVPQGETTPLQRIRLHFGRPSGVNEPTTSGVQGADDMLELLTTAGPDDVAVCLLSGGGSALLPAPVSGVSLDDKRRLTQLLHRSGATIDEMNCVRKHLSRIKGGRLAEGFRGRLLTSLIISDVVGDPLDVIASGPTAPDPTTFREALAILVRCQLTDQVAPGIVRHLERGARGEVSETPKVLPTNVVNRIIASNRVALDAAAAAARSFGYHVLDLGAFVEGETREAATVVAGVIRSIQRDGAPAAPPTCILLGGETTVSLKGETGKGGRNQEFVVAVLARLGMDGMTRVTVLSGGTDGEDGPTDAAGAVADHLTASRVEELQLPLRAYLDRHDAYRLLDRTDSLLRTGLTGTNVMDVRVILID